MIDFNRAVAIQEATIVRHVEGEAVLLNLDTQSYYALNPVGAHMLDVLTHSPTVDAAYAALVSDYDIDPATLKTDLVELIDQLLEQGLVVVA